MTDIDTAAQQAEDLARAEEVLAESLRTGDGVHVIPTTTGELVEAAKRALLKRLAVMAEDDVTGIENVAEALRAIDFA